MVPLLFSQMGAGQSFNSQFLQHGGPRGPSVPSSMNPASVGGLMGPSGMSPMGMNPTRAAGLAPLYAGQRLPQHGYPGPPQAQPLPRQGVKRAYSSEVSGQAPHPECPQSRCVEGESAVPDRVGTALPPRERASPAPLLLAILPLSSFRCILGNSTCQEASTRPPPPSTRLAPGSPPPRPPTLGTGCPCSRVRASPCPPPAPRDCTTR